MTTMAAVARTTHGMMVHEKAETLGRTSPAKNLLLFFAAPWIGLAYIIALPFVGVGALLRAAIR